MFLVCAKEVLDIHCNCCFVWCWACGEEAHKPASCKTVNQWNVKNSAESENISWIRAHTKKCPKCAALSEGTKILSELDIWHCPAAGHKPIEKNQGCNHMVCSKAALLRNTLQQMTYISYI